MITIQQEGVYSRTQAFNFLKKLLGVPKNATINEKFFGLFFRPDDAGTCMIRADEEKIKAVFSDQSIPDLNHQYYRRKLAKDFLAAQKIAEDAHNRIVSSLQTVA